MLQITQAKALKTCQKQASATDFTFGRASSRAFCAAFKEASSERAPHLRSTHLVVVAGPLTAPFASHMLKPETSFSLPMSCRAA